jgi:hypothetical protein
VSPAIIIAGSFFEDGTYENPLSTESVVGVYVVAVVFVKIFDSSIAVLLRDVTSVNEPSSPLVGTLNSSKINKYTSLFTLASTSPISNLSPFSTSLSAFLFAATSGACVVEYGSTASSSSTMLSEINELLVCVFLLLLSESFVPLALFHA